MKQKELIDACNDIGDMTLLMCGAICPYSEKECVSYMKKYRDIPYKDNEANPERYTDDVI